MADLSYDLAISAGRFIFGCAMRVFAVNQTAPERHRGSYILALTHLSHLDPFCASILLRRKVDWIASKGFFRWHLTAAFMSRMNAISLDRQGLPVRALRTAIARLRAGRVVGICPEGGVAQGKNSAMRGATIKRGVCLLALHTGRPIIPAVMLGTDKLNCPGPWLPYKRAKLWVMFGPCIHPPRDIKDRRLARRVLGEQLEKAYQDLYIQLRAAHGIADAEVP